MSFNPTCDDCAEIRSRIDNITKWKYLKVPFQNIAFLLGVGTTALLLWLALKLNKKTDIQTILAVGTAGLTASKYLHDLGRRAAVVKSRATFLKTKLERDGTGTIADAMAIENPAMRAAKLKRIHYQYGVLIDKIVDFSKGVDSKWEH